MRRKKGLTGGKRVDGKWIRNFVLFSAFRRPASQGPRHHSDEALDDRTLLKTKAEVARSASGDGSLKDMEEDEF